MTCYRNLNLRCILVETNVACASPNMHHIATFYSDRLATVASDRPVGRRTGKTYRFLSKRYLQLLCFTWVGPLKLSYVLAPVKWYGSTIEWDTVEPRVQLFLPKFRRCILVTTANKPSVSFTLCLQQCESIVYLRLPIQFRQSSVDLQMAIAYLLLKAN